jgi:hypothetical protein
MHIRSTVASARSEQATSDTVKQLLQHFPFAVLMLLLLVPAVHGPLLRQSSSCCSSMAPQCQLCISTSLFDSTVASACRQQATSETVKQLLQQHAATVSAMQRQLHLLQASSLPDPAPQPWQLNVRTETSSYFITEGALNPSDEGSGGVNPTSNPKVFAEPLGLGPNVPRFLRWDESVELAEVGIEELQQQVSSIWQGKAAYEALHGPCHLQEYLYHRFTAAAAAAAAKAAASEGESMGSAASSSSADDTGTGGSASSSDDPSVDTLDKAVEAAAAAATAAAAAAAAEGYRLYHALSQHRQSSVAVDSMWQMLTGQLPESILLEQQRQMQRLLAVLEALQQAGAAAGDGAAAGAPAAAAEAHVDSAEAVGAEAVGTEDAPGRPSAAGEPHIVGAH